MKKILLLSSLLFAASSSFLFSQSFSIQDNKLDIDSTEAKTIKHLDLSNKDLTALPSNMHYFASLESIDLSDNQIMDVSGLENCHLLKKVDLSGNGKLNLRKASKTLQQLRSLKELHLNDCRLSYIPTSLTHIATLEKLSLNGNNIKILPYELGNLKQLKQLAIRDNGLKIVKTKTYQLSQLAELDLTGNDIVNNLEILRDLEMGPNLESFSVDHTFIKGISSVQITSINSLYINDLLISENDSAQGLLIVPNVRKVALNVKTMIAYERLFNVVGQLKNLDSLIIEDHDVAKFPANINKIDQVTYIQVNSRSLRTFPSSLSYLKKLNELHIKNNEMLEVSDMMVKLGRLKSLEHLQLTYCQISELPIAIHQLDRLKTLNLTGNTIRNINPKLAELQGLKHCLLLDNPLTVDEIYKISALMPACKFDHNAVERAIDKIVRPPIPEANVPFQRFEIPSNDFTRINTESGSYIDIPKNAFLNNSGNVVRGEVVVKYREFNDPVDMVFAGIPMSFEENGEQLGFKSAGMIEFDAFQNGEQLFPNPNRPITINLVSDNPSEEYDLFYLDPDEGGWDNIGKDVVSVEESIDKDTLETFDDTIPVYPRFPYKKELLDIRVTSKQKKGPYYVKISSRTLGYNKYSKRSEWDKYFSDLRMFSKTDWRIDSKDERKIVKYLDSLNSIMDQYFMDKNIGGLMYRDTMLKRKYNEQYGSNLIDDFWITPNTKNDNLDLCIIVAGDTVRIPVLPEVKGKQPEIFQKRYKSVYDKYQAVYKLRKEDWAHIDRKHEDYLSDYEEKIDSFQERLRAYNEKYDDYYYKKLVQDQGRNVQANESNILRSFNISQFGFFNCDIIRRMDRPRQLMARMTFDGVRQKEVETYYILDDENNGVMTYGKGQKIIFDASHKNAVISILPDSKVGVISAKNFKSEVMKDASKTVPVEVHDMKTTSLFEIREKAGIL